MFVSSVDAGCSFSQYKHLLNDQGENLTQKNNMQLTMLYDNGNLE